MRRPKIFLAAAIVALLSAQSQSRTYVTLAGKDDTLRKLGLPGITVEVYGPNVGESVLVRDDIARVLADTVHTRVVGAGDAGDYVLAVTLAPTLLGSERATIPFDAVLTSADGARLWRIDGRTEVDALPVGRESLTSLGRNVVASLVHDGWVQPRYDPDNPPPAVPTIRLNTAETPR